MELMSVDNIHKLHEYIRQGDVSVVKNLLDFGVDLHARESIHHATALHIAVQQGKLEIVKLLLNDGADPNEMYANGTTPLILATKRFDKTIVKLLLKYGGNITYPNWQSVTMLHVAAVAGDKKLLRDLLVDGYQFDIDIEDRSYVGSEELTALHFAARSGNQEIVEILLECGAERDTLDNPSTKVVHSAAYGGNIEILKIFLSFPIPDIYVRTCFGETIIDYAAQGGHMEMIEFILTMYHFEEVKDKEKNSRGRNALFAAATCSRPVENVVKFLLDLGMDINETDKYKETPFIYFSSLAARSFINFDYTDNMETYLKYGANIEAADSYGKTPLIHLCGGVLHKRAIALLLKNGADPKVKDNEGITALHAVLMSSTKNYYWKIVEVVEELLKNGADVWAKDNNGKTALFYTLENGSKWDDSGVTDNYFGYLKGPEQIVKMLLQNGLAEFDASTEENINYFQSAIFNCPACIEPFLDFGFDVNGSYGKGESIVRWIGRFEAAGTVSAKIVIRYLVKMKYQNLSVSEKTLKDVQDNVEFNDMWNKCEEEIKRMKNYLGVYDLFVCKDLTKLKELTKLTLTDITSFFKSNHHKAEFPIYATYLNEQLEKEKKMRLNSILTNLGCDE